jgi:anti-sigma factor RsiW
MHSCSSLDPLVTPYIDGELAAADRDAVNEHASLCPPCRARIERERAVRDAMHALQTQLQIAAPPALRSRCERLAAWSAPAEAAPALRPPPPPATWRSRLAPLAVAATLILIVGSAFVLRTTQLSTHVIAAELTADHLKCAVVNSLAGTAQSASYVESSMATRFGWHAHLPEQPEQAGLELVGARPCLYGEGTVAHIMYRHEGSTISVFMLPRRQRPEEQLGVLGHQAAVWSDGDRTFVVVARKSREELQRIAAFIHDRLR